MKHGSPHMVLFDLHLTERSGTVKILSDRTRAELHVRHRQVLSVDAVPDLLDGLAHRFPDGITLEGGLAAALPLAVNAGIPVDDVLMEACRGLGTFLAKLVGTGATAWVEPLRDSADLGLTLPLPLMDIAVRGLRNLRSPELIALELAADLDKPLVVDTVDESMLDDLESSALECVRRCRSFTRLRDAVDSLKHARRGQVREFWWSLDLLLQLQMIEIRGSRVSELLAKPRPAPPEPALGRVPAPPAFLADLDDQDPSASGGAPAPPAFLLDLEREYQSVDIQLDGQWSGTPSQLDASPSDDAELPVEEPLVSEALPSEPPAERASWDQPAEFHFGADVVEALTREEPLKLRDFDPASGEQPSDVDALPELSGDSEELLPPSSGLASDDYFEPLSSVPPSEPASEAPVVETVALVLEDPEEQPEEETPVAAVGGFAPVQIELGGLAEGGAGDVEEDAPLKVEASVPGGRAGGAEAQDEAELGDTEEQAEVEVEDQDELGTEAEEEPAQEPEPEGAGEAAVEPEPEAEPEDGSEAEAAVEPEAAPQGEAEAAAEPEAEPDRAVEAAVEPESESESDPAAEPAVESEPEPAPEPGDQDEVAAEPEAASEPEGETELEAEPEHDEVPQPAASVEPEGEAEPESEPKHDDEHEHDDGVPAVPEGEPEPESEHEHDDEPEPEPEHDDEPEHEDEPEPEPPDEVPAEPEHEPEHEDGPEHEPQHEPEPDDEHEPEPADEPEPQATSHRSLWSRIRAMWSSPLAPAPAPAAAPAPPDAPQVPEPTPEPTSEPPSEDTPEPAGTEELAAQETELYPAIETSALEPLDDDVDLALGTDELPTELADLDDSPALTVGFLSDSQALEEAMDSVVSEVSVDSEPLNSGETSVRQARRNAFVAHVRVRPFLAPAWRSVPPGHLSEAELRGYLARRLSDNPLENLGYGPQESTAYLSLNDLLSRVERIVPHCDPSAYPAGSVRQAARELGELVVVLQAALADPVALSGHLRTLRELATPPRGSKQARGMASDHFTQAQAHAAVGDWHGAVDSIRRAGFLDPGNPQTPVFEVACLVALDRMPLSDSLVNLDSFVCPDDRALARVSLVAGHLLYRDGQLVEADNRLTRVQKLDGTFDVTHAWLSQSPGPETTALADVLVHQFSPLE